MQDPYSPAGGSPFLQDNPGKLVAQIPQWLSLIMLLWNAYATWQRTLPPASTTTQRVELHVPPKG